MLFASGNNTVSFGTFGNADSYNTDYGYSFKTLSGSVSNSTQSVALTTTSGYIKLTGFGGIVTYAYIE